MSATDVVEADIYYGDTEAVIVADVDELDEEAWLDLRRQGIGGSDAGAICGADKYRSAFECWLEKVAAPNLPDDEESEAAEWGKVLEPVVRAKTAERTGLTIRPVDLLLAHNQRTWQRANLDGSAWSEERGLGVYEGKTAGHWVAHEWDDDQTPDSYVLQGMHYLAVTGLDYLVYGCLIAGQRLVVRWVQRDQELIDHLTAIETEFWQRVIDRTPPEPDGSKSCTELMTHLWDVKPESVLTIDDPAEVELLLIERERAASDVKLAEERKAAAENKLKLVIGEHEVAVDPAGQQLFTWKQVTTNRLDGKALGEARPDVAEAFTRPSTYRRFHVPKRKTTRR